MHAMMNPAAQGTAPQRTERDHMIYLDPAALDEARQIHRFTSDEKLGNALGISGQAVRNLRSRRSVPTVQTLLKLRELTKTPLDDLVVVTA